LNKHKLIASFIIHNRAFAIGVVINKINDSQPEAETEGTVRIGRKIHGNFKPP